MPLLPVSLPVQDPQLPAGSTIPDLRPPSQATYSETRADGAPQGTELPGEKGGWQQMLLPLGFLFLFMWLFVLRPEKKRQKKRQSMLDGVKKGDRVVTLGGMHGEIAKMDESGVTLKVADGVRLRFDRNAIARPASSPADGENSLATQDRS